MKRFAEIFVLICIAVVAVAAAVTARFQLGLGWDGAAIVGFGLLLTLGALQMQTRRTRERDRLSAEMAALRERVAEIAGEVASLERRLGGAEQGGRRQGQELEQVVGEVELIGTLVRQVVETVADLEVKALQPAFRPEARHAPAVEPERSAAPVQAAPAQAATPSAGLAAEETPLVPKRFAHLGQAGFLDLVRRAIEGNRIDIHLQSIVTLPQRRIRYYEALTRLRTEDGETIYPSDYIPLAEATGIMPALDNQILFRTVQILRRLSARAKDVGLFCNISVTSLGDADFFREFAAFLEANKSLSDTLIFEFSQRQIKAMGPLEYEALRSLRDTGFRFSVDQVTDLRPSFQMMAERGFRFAKISADRILNRMDELGTDIHPADLASFFARFGIELIVDQIESESQVVDILDYGARFGQGFVFSPPRPVRSEVQVQTPEPDQRPAAEPFKPLESFRTVEPPKTAEPSRPTLERPRPAEPSRLAPDPAETARPATEPRRNALGRAIARKI